MKPLREAIIEGFGGNPPSGFTQMVRLVNIPHRHQLRRLELTLDLEETKQRGVDTMRCVFEMKLAVDIDVNDDPLRKAFIDMACNTTRGLYGPASMLAKTPPEISVSMTTRSGRINILLFETAEADDDDDNF